MPELTFGFTPATRRPYDAPLLRGVDGDTINIDQSVRMVSIDTPESKVGGSPPVAQATRAEDRVTAGRAALSRGAWEEARGAFEDALQHAESAAAWEGLSHAEIGISLGCSENAAALRLHRARRRLREELLKEDGLPGQEVVEVIK